MNILLVDDEPEILEPLEGLLAAMGFRCTPVGDPVAAAALVETRAFDLAIVDYSMPGMNGLELARRIKSAAPHTPVIMLTAFGESFYGRQEREPDVEAVLQKPVGALHLRAVVRRVLQQRRPQAES